MKDRLTTFETIVTMISKWFNWIAGLSLMLMVLLVVVDIVGTKFFKTPLPGGIELVSLLSVIAIAFAIAQTQVAHGHIEVEMLVTKLPRMVRRVISGFVHLMGISLFAILCWKSFSYGLQLQESGEVSMTLGMPYYPFVYAIGICSLIVGLVLVLQGIKIAIRNHLR